MRKNNFYRIMAMLLLLSSIIIFFAGLVKGWICHILFGLIGTIGAGFLGWLAIEDSIPYYDEKTNRYYRMHTPDDNPHHAPCPRCGQNATLITTVKPSYPARGVYCENCGEVWFND